MFSAYLRGLLAADICDAASCEYFLKGWRAASPWHRQTQQGWVSAHPIKHGKGFPCGL